MPKAEVPQQVVDFILERLVGPWAATRPSEAVRRAAVARGFVCPKTRSRKDEGFLVLQAGTNTLGDLLVLGARITPCAVRNGGPAPDLDWRDGLLLPHESPPSFGPSHDHDTIDEGWLRDEETLWNTLYGITYYAPPDTGLHPLPHPARLLRRSVAFRFECDRALDVARAILSIPYFRSPGMLPLNLFRGRGFPGDRPTPLFNLDPEIALFVRLLPHFGLRPNMSCSGHAYEPRDDGSTLSLT